MEADTYFFNADEALRVASMQNSNEDKSLTQVCYYSGEKIDSKYKNLVHIAIESLVEDLAKGIYRIPTKLDFNGFDISQEIQKEIEENFSLSLVEARKYREQFKAHYFKVLKSAKPDFNEKLRFYIPANHTSTVMQHVSKNVANALEKVGCEVLYDLDIGLTDPNIVKKAAEFNPHAIFNINHLNNGIISDDVFNFVWIQDYFALGQFKNTKLRKKDIIFTLVNSLAKHLKNLKVDSINQSFCIDTKVYKQRDEILREEKIVVIASSYKKAFDDISNENKHEVYNILLDNYILNKYDTLESLLQSNKELKERFKISDLDFGKVVNYVQRDGALLYIYENNLDYKIELYGHGWDEYPQFRDIYKGVLSYGDDVSKVYNSAKYTLVLGYYILQQRTLEAAASGCIPIVYDSLHDKNNGSGSRTCFDKSLVLFHKLDDIKVIVNKNHQVDLECIVKANSYIKFAQKIVNTINDN